MAAQSEPAGVEQLNQPDMRRAAESARSALNTVQKTEFSGPVKIACFQGAVYQHGEKPGPANTRTTSAPDAIGFRSGKGFPVREKPSVGRAFGEAAGIAAGVGQGFAHPRFNMGRFPEDAQ
jgi:hypothetical protein